MIPKIIHFCWYGRNEYSPLMETCLESWGKKHPDWKIMKWDETNSPIDHPFLKKALKDKQYAFAADYTRIYALNKIGGVYLDTDVEVVKNFTCLLENDFFIGYEDIDNSLLGTAVIGSIPQHPILHEILNWYKKNNYYLANPKIITPIVENFKHEELKVTCLSYDFFYPYNIYDHNRKVSQLLFSNITENTYSIHHWAYSWKPPLIVKIFRYIKNYVNKKI